MSRKGGEVARDLRRVGEGDALGAVVEEEVERVDRADVDRELHEDVEAVDAHAVVEGDARDVVAGGVLLPAEVARLLDGEAVRLDLGAGVLRRAEAEEVRAERGGARVAVAALVLDEEAHQAAS